MTADKKISFSAASVFPAKILLHDKLIKKAKKERKIMPLHIQLNPTNRCCFNCPFCSCSSRNKGLELSCKDILEIMEKAKKVGCESVTITGGGEPLMHKNIETIIDDLYALGIEIGLVTNGVMLNKLDKELLKKIRWIRISSSDHLIDQLLTVGKNLDAWLKTIEGAVKIGSKVDWAFSHVVSRRPNYGIIERIIKFANKHEFTHVRLVSDLLDLRNVPRMFEIKTANMLSKVDDHLVIYQGRKEHAKGTKNCYISLLKPVVGADGKLYPCCGTQYALETPTKDYEKTMCMGNAKEIDKLYEEQKFFDGSLCVKCYYKDYNYALGVLLSDVKHKKFV